LNLKALKIIKNQYKAAALLLAFMCLGIATLVFVHADTPSTSTEAENGQLAGTVTVDDPKASGGKAVSFQPVTSGGGNQPVGVNGKWTSIFDDEFNSNSVDATKWATNWFGGTDMNGYQKLASNISFSNGSVNLAVSADEGGAILTSNPYNGGGINGGFTFGTDVFLEARIHFPGNGDEIYNWPAWWTNSYNWPATGETDIFEGLGSATSNYHYGNNGQDVPDNSGTIDGTWGDGYHTYGLYRQANKNDIYWDGKLVRSYTTHDDGADQYLILTNGAGDPAVTGAASLMKVDYVRAWRAD
jgi:hypothetical protein